jgi:hypothetical protein
VDSGVVAGGMVVAGAVGIVSPTGPAFTPGETMYD